MISQPQIKDPLLQVEQKIQIIAQSSDFVIINKPAGYLSHSDGTSTAEGLSTRENVYDWLSEYLKSSGALAKTRALGMHQRLDIGTSGVMAFSLTPRGARLIDQSLKQGFKRYLAVVDGLVTQKVGEIDQSIHTAPHATAITKYHVLRKSHAFPHHSWSLLMVQPLTGRTHQIRIHLSSIKHPIKGDGRYGDPLQLRASRPLLHAYQLKIDDQIYEAPIPDDFQYYLTDEMRQGAFDPMSARKDLLESDQTTAFRLVHGKNDGFEGLSIDQYGEYLWIESQSENLTKQLEHPKIKKILDSAKGVYLLESQIDRSTDTQKEPVLFKGQPAPTPLKVYEGGVAYLVELGSSFSTGLFLDQRPQRMWLKDQAKNWRVLNTFCHAGGFSIAAAKAGAQTVNVDLSKKWLDRVHPQLQANGISTQGHDCYVGDVFDWLTRFKKKAELFDCIILDPPSTSTGSSKKRWSAQKDYGELVALALPLLKSGGRLLTATNHRQISPAQFYQMISAVMPKDMKLERVCPPGIDYPTMGFVDVKNMIWIKD